MRGSYGPRSITPAYPSVVIIIANFSNVNPEGLFAPILNWSQGMHRQYNGGWHRLFRHKLGWIPSVIALKPPLTQRNRASAHCSKGGAMECFHRNKDTLEKKGMHETDTCGYICTYFSDCISCLRPQIWCCLPELKAAYMCKCVRIKMVNVNVFSKLLLLRRVNIL